MLKLQEIVEKEICNSDLDKEKKKMLLWMCEAFL